MFDNKWQKKEMPLVSLIGMGGGIASPAFLASIVLNILKPTVFSPVDDTGVPDFDYTAESSEITNLDSQTTLDDFTNITSRTNTYEYIESDQNGSVFVTVDVSGGSYFEISQDGGATWSNSNTVTSTPWLSLRGHCFVDSPSYKGFIFGSYGPTGSGGPVPTFKSSQGNYLSWSQAGTIPSYSSSSGRYDEIATDNDGFIVACGSHSNVAYSTNNADSWTRVSPGSGGTTSSLPHWSTCTYFAKLGKFVITTSSNSSEGNSVYLSGDKSQVQSGSWTVHDNNFPENVYINDTATNDDYLFATTSSAVWRTSDLTSWTKIADFSGTDISPYRIKVKGSIVVMSDFSTTGNTGDVIASADNGANWVYKKINSGDTFGSFDVAIDKDNNIVAVNDRKSPRVARTKLNATTTLTLTDTTVSKVSDGSLVGGTTIDQVLTVGETVRADTPISSTFTASVFSTTLYNGAGTQDLNTGIDNTDKSLIWFKARDYEYPHILIDTVRGFSRLSSNNSQIAHSSGIDVSSFNDSGVSLTNGTGWVTNPSGHRMVAWNFRAAPGFFDIQTYTGISEGFASQSQAISHDLGSEPGMIIVKNLDAGDSWFVYHKDLPDRTWLRLNTNGIKSGPLDGVFPPTQSSTEFNIGADMSINRLNENYIAYLFADTPGLIKCGSFSSSGEVVNLGFRPQWIMFKSVDNNGAYTGDWRIYDTARGIVNGDGDASLYANEERVENTNAWASAITVNSNGFTVESQGAYGSSTIYVAIAENAEADIPADIYATGEVSASSSNTITLSNITGTWSTGMKVQGTDSDTKDNPDLIRIEDVSLTSSAPTAEKNVNTWGDAVWEIATDENFTQNVQTATTALSATGTQAGPSFTLERDTGYYTRTKYTALGQESEWSDVTYFVTKGLPVYADDVFSTYLYTGNHSSQSINNGIDLSGEGGLVWIKARTAPSNNNELCDTVNGIDKGLSSNNTQYNVATTITAFNNDGFDISNSGWYSNNMNDVDYVSWTFRKAPGFFDIQTWTGNGTAGHTISHNLGSVPGMIMIKNTSNAEQWQVWHRSVTGNLELDNTGTLNTSSVRVDSVTSTSFNLTGAFNTSNASGQTFVAYIFAHDDARFGANGDESIIKCGSVTTSNGVIPDVNLGFEPQFLLIKNTSTSANWYLYDSMRGMPVGSPLLWGNEATLYPNLTNTEVTGSNTVELTPTGFTGGPDYLAAGTETLIYMAIRRPHKPATVVSDVFAIDTKTPSSANTPSYISNFPVDLALRRDNITSTSDSVEFISRLTNSLIYTNYSSAENSGGTTFLDYFAYNNGWASTNGNDSNDYLWMFRRAPGFFDMVAYTGNGTYARTDLKVNMTPELVITKRRDSSSAWGIHFAEGGLAYRAYFSDSAASGGSYDVPSAGTPGRIGMSGNANGTWNVNGGKYVSYCFSSLDGISKVGSYVGNGPNGAQQVDCGFTNGAAFILVKNANSSGDWYLLDSERGINAYNETEPYVTLNTNNSQQTANMLGYHNVGFMVAGQYGSPLNNAGERYIFLAIANP